MKLSISKHFTAIVLSLGMMLSSFSVFPPILATTGNAAGTEIRYIITNPYEDVDWSAYGQYKAGLHLHTTNSDGHCTAAQMTEEHYTLGYDIIALTDHNYLSPDLNRANGGVSVARMAEMEAGTGRDGRGMIGIFSTNEQSQTDHINTYWSPFNNEPGDSVTDILKRTQDLGGIALINHPGRYTGGESSANASSNPVNVGKYVEFFNNFSGTVGIEIIGKLDYESQSDRILWDNILMRLMPEGRPVWGFSDDDSHYLEAIGYSFNIMLMPELSQAETAKAMEKGALYAVSRVDRREVINATLPDGAAMPASGTANTLYLLNQPTPAITSIVTANNAITLTGTNYDVIEWIADGVKIATGTTLHLDEHQDKLHSYVRAHLRSSTGIAYTQPFGILTEGPASHQ